MQSPNTVVLVHGLWMTPRSWEHWAERYRGLSYKVLTPAYPGLEVEVGGASRRSLADRECDGARDDQRS